METYYYKCPLCGYVHPVPAYWVSFNPEKQMEQMHMNLQTKEVCEQLELDLIDETQV